jgi:hypothetical protein
MDNLAELHADLSLYQLTKMSEIDPSILSKSKKNYADTCRRELETYEFFFYKEKYADLDASKRF